MTVAALSWLLAVRVGVALPFTASASVDPLVPHLEALEAAGRVTAQTASLSALKAGVSEAEARILAGSAETAIPLLYSFVESPRYKGWNDTAEFENAEFLLARALARSGAHTTARHYLAAILSRGSQSTYFEPACRALADDVLLQEEEQVALEMWPQNVTGTCADERAYLAGREHQKADRLLEAERAFAAVSVRSRFYAAAVYLRGLLRIRTGQYGDAKRLFCSVAGASTGEGTSDRLSFVIDGRYYGLKDLLRLGLGRLAHEQGEYDLAYYHYLQIPDESQYLRRALYEAAWSMFQKEEYPSSRLLIESYLERFPNSVEEPEARLLLAQLDLRTCAFDRARKTLEHIEDTYTPLLVELEKTMGDSEKQARLVARLIEGKTMARHEERIVSLLALDPKFEQLRDAISTLDGEVEQARATRQSWLRLAEVLGRPRGAAAGTSQVLTTRERDAAALWDDVEALRSQVRNHPKLSAALDDVTEKLLDATRPAATATPFVREANLVDEEVRAAAKARGKLVASAATFSSQALDDLLERIRRLLVETRLLHVDVVMAHKKKLEREISTLSEGRLPAQVSRAVGADVLLEDDEEYWPYEGEHWADEVENYK